MLQPARPEPVQVVFIECACFDLDDIRAKYEQYKVGPLRLR